MLPKKHQFPYTYVKAQVTVYNQPGQPAGVTTKKHTGHIRRLIPGVLITLGSIMIANVAWPIVSYQLMTAPQLQKAEFVSPSKISPATLIGMGPENVSPQDMTKPPQVLGAALDYTNAKNWFPSAQFAGNLEQPKEYLISIPSLNVIKAEVVIGGEDLDSNLIHYPGTAAPGQLGSPVIFGHSVLRQFYNPALTNPNRYQSIFSKIMTLKDGAEIFVDYDGIHYTYEVKDKVEVKPEDIFILEQRYNNRELKLITCVPEGTYLRRGVVLAQLVDKE